MGVDIKRARGDSPIFRFLEQKGGVSHREMFNIFIKGIGMVVALDAAEAERAAEVLNKWGELAVL